MKNKLFNPTMLAAAAMAATMATGCTTAWWDTTISPYDYFDDPMAPPPPGLYPLPSRPIFYPDGYGPALPPPPPQGWNRPSNRPPVNNQRPPQNDNNQRPPQNGNQKPPQNGNTQRPGGNVKPGTNTGTNIGTNTGGTGGGSHSTVKRRGGNVK